MRDLRGSIAFQRAAQPAAIAPAIADSRHVMWARIPRRVLLALATLAAVFLCAIHFAYAGADTVHAAGVGYLCLTLVLFACAFAFLARARSSQGTLRIRWTLIAAAAFFASIAYFPSFTECFLSAPPVRQLPIVCFNLSEVLYMLATVLFFAGVARSIVVMDMLQALLFVVLRFNLAYSAATRDHFSIDHLIFSLLVALFLFLIALVACLGAASPAELKFLRTLSWFSGLRLLGMFLANQVCYTWLGHRNCGLWDVPGPALLAGFALYLFYTNPAAGARSKAGAVVRLNGAGIECGVRSGVIVRILMPSFLALVNLMLGLFLLRASVPLAAAAISISLVCYVARAVMLQAQAAQEHARLEIRNEQLEGLAIRDPLTGIGNRRFLAAAYSRLQASAGGGPLALLLMDIDWFKQANDRHGHLYGDKLLVALARKLEAVSAGIPGSRCARFGGDEFALLVPGVSVRQASALAEDLRVTFGAHGFESVAIGVTLSIGVASLGSARGLTLETLIAQADNALYRAKLSGRNRVDVLPIWESAVVVEDAPEQFTAPELDLELQRTAG